MCTFISSLPKKSVTKGTNKKSSLVCAIRPCPDEPNGDKTWYRFRLLAFKSAKTNRDYPIIERFVHQHWGKNDKGQPVMDDEIVCPVTKWTDWEGDRYGCPVCQYANQNFLALKESNWRDATARQKNREFGRKYQAIVPVYVVNDPNYAGNNGKFKVIIFWDKKQYQAFEEKIKKASMTKCVFNGKQAVDCCIHMSEVPEVRNEGQPNEYVYKAKVIDRITFSKDPYDIDAITKEAVDAFPFDETYYVQSTKEEINDFYNKYIKISNNDIPDDDDIEVYSKAEAPSAAPIEENAKKETSDIDIDNSDILTADSASEEVIAPVEVPVKKAVKNQNPSVNIDEVDVDALLNDSDI